MSFNPNLTQTLGLEWPVSLSALNWVDAMSKGHIERFSSSVTETIDKADFYLQEIGEGGLYSAEVYTADDLVPTGLTTLISTPRTATGQRTTDQSGGFPWMDAALGAVGPTDFTISAGGDTPADAWNEDAFVQNATATETQAHLAFRGGTGLASFAGLRILRVDLWARWKVEGGAGINGRAIIENAAGNDLVVGEPRNIPFGSNFTNTRLARWDVDPNNGRPWTAAGAGLYFSDSSTRRYGVRCAWSSLPTAVKITALWANVVVCDENRLAYGHLSISANDGWKSFSLETPAGADNWAKASGVDYDVLLRRVGDTGGLAWPYLSAPQQSCPHVGHQALTATLNGSYGIVSAVNDTPTRAHPLRLVRTDAANSADSQPYNRLGFAQVYTGSTWRSEFAGAAATGYGFIKAVLRPALGAPSDLADMTVKVKRTSDNVQLGGTYTLSKEEVDRLPELTDGFKLARFQIATATLAAGVGYYIEFASSAGGVAVTRRWDIAYVSADGGKGATGYGGTASSINIGGVDFADADFAATISVPPAAPAGFAVTLVTP